MNRTDTENSGMRLLGRGPKGLIRCIFGRMGLVLVLLLVKVLYLLSVFLWFADYLPQVFSGHMLIAVAMVIVLLNSKLDPTAKITWLVLIIPKPLFGSMLFLFTQSELGQRAMKRRLKQLNRAAKEAIRQDAEAFAKFQTENAGAAAMAHYVASGGCYPVFGGCEAEYFPLGEDKFARLLTELEKAENYIFLEYFIVEEGIMWGKILEILARKAAEGVEVRVMYDGTCEFALLPKGYPKKLKKLGIQCKVFSPVTPLISTHYNYRDHRKICVIDGHTAFTGGINLADEYINAYEKHGHWKDTAVIVKGEAAKSFALMFLQLWSITEREFIYEPYLTAEAPRSDAKGYVMPYGDDPLDGEKVGKRVYIDLLNRAKRYVHIMTPYLIMDAELENALTYAAKRGVEVSLLLAGVPDKKIPYAMAKTHYRALLQAGVKLYEYTPGFVHAKGFVVDDQEAVVGTINLDYRSLYHHFECALYLCGVDCIGQIEADFSECVSKSREVTLQTLRKEKWYMMLVGYVMKLFAPLM